MGIIPANVTYVVAFYDLAFHESFVFFPDAVSGSVNGNGDDVYTASYRSEIVDTFCVIGTGGSLEPWYYLDSLAQRDPNELANPAFQLKEWSITPGVRAATLGVHNPTNSPPP